MKNYTDTALHVYFAGNLRIHNCDQCCSRWYFTFNGAECSSPGSIDGVFYMTTEATLKVTVITFTRQRCEWDSGWETATLATRMLMLTQAGPKCPGSLLKRCRRLSSEHVTRDQLEFLQSV